VTGPVPSPNSPRPWLGEATHALEIGDWPFVLGQKGPPLVLDGSPEAAALVVLVRIVAFSMRLQALGDVTEAWEHLAIAAGRLAPMLCRRTAGQPPLALMTPQPTAAAGLLLWTWRVSLVIWREQTELRELRAFFVAADKNGRDQLVAVCVEYLRWIADDPWTWKRATFVAQGVRAEPSRANIYARANRLVRFADPTAGDLDFAIWKRAHGYPALHAGALEMLAAGPSEPWTGGKAPVPVRDGRRVAWERATR
jgi:hypothetical protein